MKPGNRFAPQGPPTRCSLATLLAVATMAMVSASCGDELLCGRDTVEVDGRCVPAAQCLITCQPGTVLDETIFGCVPEFSPRVCDPDTTVEEQGTDGVFVCSGAAVSTCELPVACPEPSSLQVAVVCGRIIDVESQRPETGDGVGDGGDDGGGDGATYAGDNDDDTTCDPTAPASGGPCSLRLRLFDAAALAESPGEATALEATVTIDSCGRFAAEHTPPAGDQLAIEVDDGDDFDDRARTITAVPRLRAGSLVDGVRAFTVRSSTDARWTADSDSPTSFEESGASLALYRESGGAPASGIEQADALFFDEPARRVARVAPALTATGGNGAALTSEAPAAPTRDGQACLDSTSPFAPGLIWVTETTVTCP